VATPGVENPNRDTGPQDAGSIFRAIFPQAVDFPKINGPAAEVSKNKQGDCGGKRDVVIGGG
jgi:hypothetical protein